MNKKFLSLVLALVMVLGTFGSVFAAEAPKADAKKDAKVEETKKVPEKKDNNAKVQWLVDNEIVLGRKMYKDEKNNDLALDKNIQRAEITKLLVYAIGRQDLATKIHGQVKPYSDVKNDHWANGFITVGTTMASPKNALPFLHGYVDGSFKPENDVTYVELAKMLVVLVKDDLTQADFKSAVWPRDWMAWAAKLGILDGVKVEDSAKAAVREDAFVMLYNALYKLGELRNLPAHETMGIISAADANKITLNQGDFKKEFTVNSSTNFVPANYSRDAKSEITFWANVVKGNETYYIGSLVRVLADDKGNVTHIVQLGNPEKGAIEGSGWTAVAQKVQNFKSVTLGDLSKVADINTVAKTRYFVADYANRQLTEVKDKAAVLALFDRTTKDAEKVYVGYDVLPNSKIKEANVVVFNKVDKSAIQEDLVRVVTPMNNKYELTAQEPGQTATTEKTFDLRNYKAAFPLNADLEKYDVINLSADMGKVVIDHSKDNIYKVVDIDTEKIQNIDKVNGRTVEMKLSDGYGTRTVDIVSDADLFFGNQIKKDAFVQVRFVNTSATTPAVDIVSVVPETECRGFLPYGVDGRQVTGTVASVENVDPNNKDGYVVFTINEIKDGKTNPYAVPFVARKLDLAKLNVKDANDLVGKTITFKATKATNQYHGLALATNIVLKSNADAKALLALVKGDFEAVENLGKDKAKDGQKAKEAAVDAWAKKVLEKYKGVTATQAKRTADGEKYEVTFTHTETSETVNASLAKTQVEK